MLAEEEDVLHSWFAHDVADRDQLTAEDMLRPELDRAGAILMGRDSYDHAKGALGTAPAGSRTRSWCSPTGPGRMTYVRARLTDGLDVALERAAAAGPTARM